MPTPGHSTRSNRKGHYSCAFCRSRKLRCDRPLPCTNCATRRKTCHFEPDTSQHVRTPGTRTSTNNASQQQLRASSTSIPPLPSPQPSPHSAPHQENLLAEIRALKKLALDLEKRVTQTTGHQSGNDVGDISLLASAPSPDESTAEAGPTSSSSLGEVGEVVAHLERVSMGKGPREPSHVDDPVLKIGRIRDIPNAPSYTTHLGKHVRCVWLPQLDETKVLLETFVNNISYIYHVVHHPSLPGFVDDVYCRIAAQEPVKPGHIVLLLSIIASATLVWIPPDDVDGENQLFTSSAKATAQTPLWVKATQDMLNGTSGPPPALETVQGIIILSFLVCNLEGVSLRYRLLISTGLLLGRELGLHRIDHESNMATANTIGAEMGRRAWWYLVATDWLRAAIYGGPGEGVYQASPRQMTVHKPRNINDADLLLNLQDPDRPESEPLSQPTEMSYFLQRIRLAEISRSIADHNSMAASGSARPSYYAHVMAMDVELDQIIHDMPPFFNLDTYDRCPDSDKSGIFIQAYLLNSIVNTQRCKLQLGYLTSRPNKSSPAYASSWATCLDSARQINRAEKQLERAKHPFALIRRRLSGILYGVFMASVVLLMDACGGGNGWEEGDARRRETEEALRVVERARSYSTVAASLYDWLARALAKHGLQVQQPLPRPPESLQREDASSVATPSTGTTAVNVHQGPDPLAPEAIAAQTLPGDSYSPQDGLPIANGQPSDSNQLFQDLEQLMDMDGHQWDNLFLGNDSSSFF